MSDEACEDRRGAPNRVATGPSATDVITGPQIEATPVTKTARDLTEITRLNEALEAQAVAKSNDRLMPGGLAMVSLAPVANLEAWEYQYETCERVGLDRDHIEDEDDAWEPVLQTLLFWSEQWRVIHGAEYGQRPTVTSEAAFIRWALNWAWDNEVQWDDFAIDIRRARVRLEDLLHAGKRTERTRVPCTIETCDRKPRLIKVYANAARFDHYKCPACKTRYEPKEFARAKLRLLAAEGADRHVKMQDARDAVDRPERTWSKWLRYWYVRSYRDPTTGQTWVWWPDVREMDVATQRRERAS